METPFRMGLSLLTDRSVRDQMVARGWLAEDDGPNLVVMCAPQ